MGAKQREDLTGKVIIVTGANSGIGKESAVELAAMGATVVMTARSQAKGDAARTEVIERSGSDRVVLGSLDLASFASVRTFAAWFLDEFDRLDVLINNAGLIVDTRRETADGFELMFGTNHLGHFLLTDLLRERLIESAPSRVIVVSSVAHRWALTGLDREDLQCVARFGGSRAYGASKLANVQFAFELSRQLADAGVTVNAVHPGSIHSGFAADGDTGASGLGWWMATFGPYVLRTPRSGAKTQVLLASSTSPRIAGRTGHYWSHGRRWPASRHARSRSEARWLWEESARLVAETP
ncbi:MAG: dehydrogenase [Ilumatobacteraceae bacterium]|nr:dehydrogenase [Ilumatobacteraceae bacterium]